MCTLGKHRFLWGGFTEQPLIACVHCALLIKNSVSCKQFSSVCVQVCFYSQTTAERRRERDTDWERKKWEAGNFSHQQDISSTPLICSHEWIKWTKTTVMHEHTMYREVVLFVSLLKCTSLQITHRRREETNNKWHPESNSIQTGKQAK